MEVKRDIWSSRLSFILAAVGSAVGLGNVWRFPYIAYKYGGGAFLIPFFTAIFIAGIPLLILEYYLGQSTQQGAPGALAKVGKNWETLGWFAVFVGFFIVTYYSVIMGWAFGFLFKSFSFSEATVFSDFFYKDFLKLSDGIMNIGGINIFVLLGLIATWAAIVFCVFKGTRSVGKVVLITVPLPFLILIIFTIRGITLKGAVPGLLFFLRPDFSALLKVETWLAAFGQVFFSFSIGFGVMITYASFQKKGSDITNNAFMTGLIDSATAYIAGYAVFSALGYLAVLKGLTVPEVAKSGPGLAFVVFPEIIAKLPFMKLFFVLFFLMLLTLGIDSAFSLFEAFTTAIGDKIRIKRAAGLFLFAVIGIVLGFIYATKAGLYWLDSVDYFLSNYGLIIVGLLECIAVGWMLDIEKVRGEINEVSDFKIGKWWNICVKFLIPFFLCVLLLVNTAELLKNGYEGYPARVLFLTGPVLLYLGVMFSIFMKNIGGIYSAFEKFIMIFGILLIITIALYFPFAAYMKPLFNRLMPVIMGIFGFAVIGFGIAHSLKKLKKEE